MKLRNKKTKKVFDAIVREKSNGDGEYSIIVCDIRAIRCGRATSSVLGEYDSLTEFNEDWEDYEPAEPRIKDEKVRKAVRAWLEANGLEGASYYTSSHHWYLRSFNHREQGIDFWLNLEDKYDLNENEYYTKTELCGEEEE